MADDGQGRRARWVANLGAKAGAFFDYELHHEDNCDPSAAEEEIIREPMIISSHEQEVL